MTPDIAALLAIDGVSRGAIYALIATGFVLIFLVTRVIFVPFGDIAAMAALTLAALEQHQAPGTIQLLIVLSLLTSIVELVAHARRRRLARAPRTLLFTLVIPVAIAALAWSVAATPLPAAARIALTLLLVLPIAPLLDRLVFRPVADASVLLLLVLAVALHFALAGISLVFFGPEGVRTDPLTDYVLGTGDITVQGQVLLIVAAALAFTIALSLFFNRTITGKALRATAINRVGARLVGIRPGHAATIAYLVASLMAGVSGVLIAPVDTMFYDSGFLLGLVAFVGAIIGGMSSYTLTAIGALLVGQLESFASFYSSAFKEALVFALLIPVLLWRSLASTHSEEEVEE